MKSLPVTTPSFNVEAREIHSKFTVTLNASTFAVTFTNKYEVTVILIFHYAHHIQSIFSFKVKKISLY